MTDSHGESLVARVGERNEVPTASQQLLAAQQHESLDDVQCGFNGWTPDWLQVFASKKSYIVNYGLLGMFESSIGSYYTGTISTMEKRFNLPSTASGIISSSWDTGSMATSLIIAYFGNTNHKTRWVAAGLVCMSLACFIQYLPHYIYGPGVMAMNQASHSVTENNLCNNTVIGEESCSLNSEGTFTFLILLVAHLLLGVGSATYYTLATAYLDDNIRKNKIPFILGLVSAIYYIGPALGFLISSFTLSFYINLSHTPSFGEDDPRWIGAWQLGWIPFGIFGFIVALLMALFPKVLPREAERRRSHSTRQYEEPSVPSFNDFKESLIRLSKNSLLVMNTISYVLYCFATSGFVVFLPKYIEAQFRRTASEANIIAGSVGILCTSIGSAIGGAIISKYRPSSRVLAAWSVAAETIEMISFASFAYLGCYKEDMHGSLTSNGRWDLSAKCNVGCNCSSTMEYAPVCSSDQSMTFFSPCHAGCTISTLTNNTQLFDNCSCVQGAPWALDGACPSDCSSDFHIFTIILFSMELIASTGRPANTVIQFRAVEPKDKAMMIAISEVLFSGLGWIPGPVFYGIILDYSCLIWEMNCGESGNCWFYDGQLMRFLLNYTAAGLVFLAILLDIGVWMKVGHLKIYDENHYADKVDDKEQRTRDAAVCEMDLRQIRRASVNPPVGAATTDAG